MSRIAGWSGWCMTLVVAIGPLVVGCDERQSAGQAGTTSPVSTAGLTKTDANQSAAPPAAGPAQPGRTTASGKPMPGLAKGALGPPPIVFEPAILDLGEVRPNQRVSGTIYIRNTSDKALKILTTKPDCSCTSINLTNVPLLPGEQVAMEPTFQSGNMGEKLSGVKVMIENYDEVVVNLKALVTLPISADPAFASAVPDAQGKISLKGEYTIRAVDGRPFRVEAVNRGAPPFVDFDPARDQPRNTYRLSWDLSGYDPTTCMDGSGNRIPGWLIIETDHPDCPVLDVEVRHACTMRARPTKENPWPWVIGEKRFLLGKMEEGRAQEIEIVAKWLPAARQMRDPISSVASDSDQFSAELASIEQTSDGMVCNVRVTPAPGHKGLVYGTLHLKGSRHSMSVVIIGAVK
ncbi:MAG: DUF1573 domain-containing protein [Phycisphaerales bacterium]|nr:DUF1573 domain-containing protein [Phycisphaerales bacterium]MCI0630238.1 DUF1573 domain-containing protein [Phycisphaerales bacterium]MCI0676090.1 DUF1573 domain-containing protein [Phycisphaerales bacterium]